jgi:hypothetical protein
MIRKFLQQIITLRRVGETEALHDLERRLRRTECHDEIRSMLCARAIIEQTRRLADIPSLRDVEFKCFSQFGDDGIIQYLIHRLNITHRTFIEFGVEDYTESNTRFLLMNDNWRGLIMDGSADNMQRVQHSDLYWRHNLTVVPAFIDAQNINSLIEEADFAGPLGILSVDIDGNDYWVWEAIRVVDPIIVIVEYNSVFGPMRPISVPYNATFVRSQAHYSHLYWGASISAFCHLATQKGYAFIGCNSAGNNAYFVRRDQLPNVQERTAEEGYVESQFRESRGEDGKFSFLKGSSRLECLRGLPVVNVVTGESETI